MIKTRVIENQNMIDLVIAKYGNAESVVLFCLQNGIAINGEITPGDQLLIDEAVAYRETGFVLEPLKESLKENLTIIENQNLIDVVTQEYGSVEALIRLCTDNNIGLDTVMEPGTKVKISSDAIVRKQLISFLKSRGIKIASGEVDVAEYLLLENDFFLLLENGFKIILG